MKKSATVAQLVERITSNDEVVSSNLAGGSKNYGFFFLNLENDGSRVQAESSGLLLD
jgi:hypothetical protein